MTANNLKRTYNFHVRPAAFLGTFNLHLEPVIMLLFKLKEIFPETAVSGPESSGVSYGSLQIRIAEGSISQVKNFKRFLMKILQLGLPSALKL